MSMKKSFSSKIVFCALMLAAANISFAQDKVKIKDVRKNCVKGSYRICIKMAKQYLNQEPASFEGNYLLGVAYAGQANEHTEAHKKFAAEHPKPTATDQVEEKAILINEINCSDSSAIYYSKSEPLLGESFIKKNINACKVGMGGCYNEFSGSNTTLESARKMILSEVKRWQNNSANAKRNHDSIK
jgi:hypothetical protein